MLDFIQWQFGKKWLNKKKMFLVILLLSSMYSGDHDWLGTKSIRQKDTLWTKFRHQCDINYLHKYQQVRRNKYLSLLDFFACFLGCLLNLVTVLKIFQNLKSPWQKFKFFSMPDRIPRKYLNSQLSKYRISANSFRPWIVSAATIQIYEVKVKGHSK